MFGCCPGLAEQSAFWDAGWESFPPLAKQGTGREMEKKTQQKAAARTLLSAAESTTKPHASTAFLPRCDAAIAPGPRSSCAPDTSHH